MVIIGAKMSIEVDKAKMLDSKGAPLTQGLFLETAYSNTENVVYTLKPRDHVYKGKKLYSIRRLFLEVADPTEYEFAYKYFLDWEHWQRIKANQTIYKHLKGMEYELEVKLRSEGVKNAIDHARNGTFQAAKWLADRGWEKRGAGRPTKEAVEHEKKVQQKLSSEWAEDVARLDLYRKEA